MLDIKVDTDDLLPSVIYFVCGEGPTGLNLIKCGLTKEEDLACVLERERQQGLGRVLTVHHFENRSTPLLLAARGSEFIEAYPEHRVNKKQLPFGYREATSDLYGFRKFAFELFQSEVLFKV